MGTIVGRSCENKNTTRTTGDRLQSVIPVRYPSPLVVHDRDGEGYYSNIRVVCAHFTFVHFFIFLLLLLLFKCTACTESFSTNDIEFPTYIIETHIDATNGYVYFFNAS